MPEHRKSSIARPNLVHVLTYIYYQIHTHGSGLPRYGNAVYTKSPTPNAREIESEDQRPRWNGAAMYQRPYANPLQMLRQHPTGYALPTLHGTPTHGGVNDSQRSRQPPPTTHHSHHHPRASGRGSSGSTTLAGRTVAVLLQLETAHVVWSHAAGTESIVNRHASSKVA